MHDFPLQKHNLRGKLDLDAVSKARLGSTTVENASALTWKFHAFDSKRKLQYANPSVASENL